MLHCACEVALSGTFEEPCFDDLHKALEVAVQRCRHFKSRVEQETGGVLEPKRCRPLLRPSVSPAVFSSSCGFG